MPVSASAEIENCKKKVYWTLNKLYLCEDCSFMGLVLEEEEDVAAAVCVK